MVPSYKLVNSIFQRSSNRLLIDDMKNRKKFRSLLSNTEKKHIFLTSCNCQSDRCIPCLQLHHIIPQVACQTISSAVSPGEFFECQSRPHIKDRWAVSDSSASCRVNRWYHLFLIENVFAEMSWQKLLKYKISVKRGTVADQMYQSLLIVPLKRSLSSWWCKRLAS